MARTLVLIGLALVALGLLWPFLSRLGLGRLPGDIDVQREGFRFYAPLATCLVASLVLTLLVWIFRR